MVKKKNLFVCRWLRQRANRRPPWLWRKPPTSSASLRPPCSCATCRRSTPSPPRRTPPSSSPCLSSCWRPLWSSDVVGCSWFLLLFFFLPFFFFHCPQTVNMVTVITWGLAGEGQGWWVLIIWSVWDSSWFRMGIKSDLEMLLLKTAVDGAVWRWWMSFLWFGLILVRNKVGDFLVALP